MLSPGGMNAFSKMLKDAQEKKYCIGFFESWNLESLEAVINAAEETNSPVIIGFNSGIITNEKRILKPQDLEYLSAICNVAKKQAIVPVASILNENHSIERAIEGIKLGFDIVMLENEEGDYEKYVENVKRLTDIAHASGVYIEGSLGELPWSSDGKLNKKDITNGTLTDPQQAVDFVERTGIDILAISIGNIHVLTNGEANLDYKHLKKLYQTVDIPFVIHGGSGISDSELEQMSKLGVVKVNYGTILNQAFIEGIQKGLKKNKNYVSPKFLLGSGYSEDILAQGRVEMKELVIRKIKACRSDGQMSNIT